MLNKLVNKIKLYFKNQKQAQELRELIRIDYRMEKELMAISKTD